MSHVKNMQAFDQIIGACTGLGGNYNPGQQNLSVQALTTLSNNAHDAATSVKLTRSDFKNATNNREAMFEGMNKLAVRILSALKSSNVMEQTIADAMEVSRRLAGRKASRDPVPSEATAKAVAKKRRAIGTDYVSMADNFETLLQIVRGQPSYKPNIADLKIDALQATLNNYRALNNAVIASRLRLSHAIIHRDRVMYKESGNVHDTAMAVKNEVKAIYGHSSEVYKTVSKLRVNER